MWDFARLRFVADPKWGLRFFLPAESQATAKELAERKRSIPTATALPCSADSVIVLCLYCHKAHKHGIEHFARWIVITPGTSQPYARPLAFPHPTMQRRPSGRHAHWPPMPLRWIPEHTQRRASWISSYTPTASTADVIRTSRPPRFDLISD